FSVQVPLANGSSVYIDEAEVVYNRQTSNAPGFGVRFLRVNPASEEAIRQEIRRLSPKTLPKATRMLPEEAPTLVPAAFGGDVAMQPTVNRAPSTWESALDLDRPSVELGPSDLSGRPVAIAPWRIELRDWFWRYARRMGLLFAAMAAVTILTATVLFLWSSPRPEGILHTTALSGVQSDTFEALMEDKPAAVKVTPPPPAIPSKVERKRPLPGLVPTEMVEETNEPEEPLDFLDAINSDQFEFRLSRRARVKRTMIYRSPERFVIDLANQDKKLKGPTEATGGIKRFRVGRHPGFVRLVLDAARPIERASAEIEGRRLRVSITYR
ncbi:MAG: AMIN domain-containing protein, partial [Myxococcota bacterium]